MIEQAKSSQEITAAASDLDQQTREASRAMKEQARGFKQITVSSANITKQIKLIAAANLDNSQSTDVILRADPGSARRVPPEWRSRQKHRRHPGSDAAAQPDGGTAPSGAVRVSTAGVGDRRLSFRLMPIDAGPKALRVPDGIPRLLRDLIHDRTGIFFEDSRMDLLLEKLEPLAQSRGFGSFLDYYYALKDNERGEWDRAWEALSVQETYFWREMSQINALVETIVPAMVSKTLAALSHLVRRLRHRRRALHHCHGAGGGRIRSRTRSKLLPATPAWRPGKSAARRFTARNPFARFPPRCGRNISSPSRAASKLSPEITETRDFPARQSFRTG